jgi:isocitrate dehydrogenase (NAD+)
MSGVMMLEHMHEDAVAQKIRTAYRAVLTEADPRKLTRDMGGTAGTSQFADAVITAMQRGSS